jgi:hypothetical protein
MLVPNGLGSQFSRGYEPSAKEFKGKRGLEYEEMSANVSSE